MSKVSQKSQPFYVCQVSKKRIGRNEAMHADMVREPILQLIQEKHPEFDREGYISIHELNRFRQLYAHNMMMDKDKNSISLIDKQVLQSIADNELISMSPDEFHDSNSYGNRLADKIASFGGSWKFIISFAIFIAIWLVINSLAGKAFDPFPFILLNLMLSCLAALQAPVIMMSQNRQEAKDRLRSMNDYQINVKAEIEVRQLQEKMDMALMQLAELKRQNKSA